MRTSTIADLLVEAADKLIVPRFRALEQGEVMEKQPGDPVTIADREAEEFITERILAAFPGSVVLGEEATQTDPGLVDRFLAADHGWTLDPLDGTRNFVAGIPEFAVMLTETVGGVLERTWIWRPMDETMYITERGRGILRNGSLLPRTPIPAAPYRGVTADWAAVTTPAFVAEPIGTTNWFAGRHFPQLVEGTLDFFVSDVGVDWDHLPGLGLLTESGGVLRTETGAPYEPGVESAYLIAAGSEPVWAVVHEHLAGTSVRS